MGGGANGLSSDAEFSDGDYDKLEIDLPTDLKRILIRDWEHITRQKQVNLLLPFLFPIFSSRSHTQVMQLPKPKHLTASAVLNAFQTVSEREGSQTDVIREVVSGLKDYFNQALRVTLLYKFERLQNNKILEELPNKNPCEIYGCEHLCRLFVKLPQLLAPNDLDPNTKMVLKQKIHEMIKFCPSPIPFSLVTRILFFPSLRPCFVQVLYVCATPPPLCKRLLLLSRSYRLFLVFFFVAAHSFILTNQKEYFGKTVYEATGEDYEKELAEFVDGTNIKTPPQLPSESSEESQNDENQGTIVETEQKSEEI